MGSSSSRQGQTLVERPGKKNRLLLHFDVNNTLLAADPVSATGVVGAVNCFVAGILWGHEVDGAFQYSSEPASIIAPREGMISYYKYLEGQFEAAGRPRSDFKHQVGKFSELPENAVAKRWVDDILAALRTDIDNDRFSFEESGARYHLVLPSFWHMVSELQKEGREFAVVLRTYGTDGARLAETIHAFGMGEHSEYPEGCAQVRSCSRCPLFKLDRSSGDDLRLLDDSGDGTEVIAGDEVSAFNFIETITGTAACRDDFGYWKKGGFTAAAGKPVWVPCAVAGSSSHHILFDDNIRVGSPDNSIADGRMVGRTQDGGGWKSLGPCGQAEAEAAGCLVAAELHRSALDKNYFINQVRKCEERWKGFTAKYAPVPEGQRCCI